MRTSQPYVLTGMKCDNCGKEVLPVDGNPPVGWSALGLTLTENSGRTMDLCPSCTQVITQALEIKNAGG